MADTSNHITSFKVENFKRFETFEMANLGQFNLIVGDNNVGKTSVLEALLFSEPTWLFFNNLFVALTHRSLKEKFLYKDLDLYSNKELSLDKLKYAIDYKVSFVNGRQSAFGVEFDKTNQRVSIKGIPNDSTAYHFNDPASLNPSINTPFIPFYKGHGKDLTTYFSAEILKSRVSRKRMIESLKIIIPDIDEIQLSSPDPNEFGYLVVSQTNLNATIPLALFGDGVLKLFRILIEILINRGKRLMIDEIDTGIHFSRFKDFWKTILKAAKENDVQLFMTTHNEECIRYFVEVLSDSEMKSYQSEARSISLVELPDKSVKAYTYPFDHLEANITMGNDVRGGAR